MVVVDEAQVHRGSRGRRGGAEAIGQVPDELEIVLAADARAPGDNNTRRLEVHLLRALVLF